MHLAFCSVQNSSTRCKPCKLGRSRLALVSVADRPNLCIVTRLSSRWGCRAFKPSPLSHAVCVPYSVFAIGEAAG